MPYEDTASARLTVTKVVFEWIQVGVFRMTYYRLTVTKVVFEWIQVLILRIVVT